MAFWGIEVKPGKPYTHRHNESQGRLHVSQATLGNGKGMTKSVLQCNVGSRSPVLLCSLFPERLESCHLELQFEEDDDVVFSVIGPRSIHLTGFFVGSRCRGGYIDDDEFEPYGEDIGEEDSSDSFDSEEDNYESDFIDDSSMEIFPSSPPKSSVVIEEIIEDDKPIKRNANNRRLKKNYLLSDTDDDNNDSHQIIVKPNPPPLLESEDEDGLPVSSYLNSKSTVEGKTRPAAKIVDEDRKRKMNDSGEHAESAREDGQLCDSSLPLVAEDVGMQRKRKKVMDGKPHEDLDKVSADKIASEPNQDMSNNTSQEMPRDNASQEMSRGKDFASGVEGTSTEEHDRKKKKKNKDIPKRIEISETEIALSSEKNEEATKSDPNEVGNIDGFNQENHSEAGKLPDSREEHSGGKNRKTKKRNKNKVTKDENKVLVGSTDMQEAKHSTSADILSITNAHLQKAYEDTSVMDEDLRTTKDKVSDDKVQKQKKKKKKRGENLDKENSTDQKSFNLLVAEENVEPRKARNFSNGLTVEEISMGKPDGKKASPGSKVFINYIGKLQNGEVFESNVGGKPFRFLLGVGQVIKGWDIGIKGMRVGDKRRLTIPPSMGYQEKNDKDKPMKSWLVYDVELVDVQ